MLLKQEGKDDEDKDEFSSSREDIIGKTVEGRRASWKGRSSLREEDSSTDEVSEISMANNSIREEQSMWNDDFYVEEYNHNTHKKVKYVTLKKISPFVKFMQETGRDFRQPNFYLQGQEKGNEPQVIQICKIVMKEVELYDSNQLRDYRVQVKFWKTYGKHVKEEIYRRKGYVTSEVKKAVKSGEKNILLLFIVITINHF